MRQQAAGCRLLLEAATASMVSEHWKAKDSASHSWWQRPEFEHTDSGNNLTPKDEVENRNTKKS